VTAAARGSEQFFATLGEFGTVLCMKLYRLGLETDAPIVPVLPCLDHEAMLHEGISPHAAAYLQDAGGDLHEVVYIPGSLRIDVDTVSTLGERSPNSHERLLTELKGRCPECTVREIRPSWIRGDLRVAKACRAQVTLREVLLGSDLERTKASVDRLQTISSLMEKHSRVASWGARTVMTPLLALAGFVMYQALASLDLATEYQWVASLRYVVVGLVGAYFLYYGLKAVQLTEMANRVWKRSAEYGLILNERKRIGGPQRSALRT
jgi:hypothetical protein